MQFTRHMALALAGIAVAKSSNISMAENNQTDLVGGAQAHQHNQSVRLFGRKTQCLGSPWGTFYDDRNCTVNPTQAFSMDNDGCIANMRGKKSIYIQPSCRVWGEWSMVLSPMDTCVCQSHCQTVPESRDIAFKKIAKPTCWDISEIRTNGFPEQGAYRFINEGCACNNCPYNLLTDEAKGIIKNETKTETETETKTQAKTHTKTQTKG